MASNVNSVRSQKVFNFKTNVAYEAKRNGTVIVGNLLIDGSSGSVQQRIGKIAREMFKKFPPTQSKWPPGVRKLRVARNVVNKDGSRELGQLRRYTAMMQVPIWDKNKKVSSFYWTGGQYSDPWVASAITQIAREALQSAKTYEHQRSEKKSGEAGNTARLPIEEEARQALAKSRDLVQPPC